VVDRSSFSCVGSVFHARGAATEKAVSPIRRRVRGTTRSPDDEARSADRARTSATDVSKSEMYTLTTLTLTFEPIPNRNFFSGTPMVECCRVDDTPPERVVTGLSPG